MTNCIVTNTRSHIDAEMNVSTNSTSQRMTKMHTFSIKLGTFHCEFNTGLNEYLLIFE